MKKKLIFDFLLDYDEQIMIEFFFQPKKIK